LQIFVTVATGVGLSKVWLTLKTPYSVQVSGLQAELSQLCVEIRKMLYTVTTAECRDVLFGEMQPRNSLAVQR